MKKRNYKKAIKKQQKNPHNVKALGNLLAARKKRRQDSLKKMK